MHKYNAESPKQGSKRFNSNAKTKYIADLGIMYLWSSLNRLYPACYNGDIQAINAGSQDVHINLQYKKCADVQGKWLRTTVANKHKCIKKYVLLFSYLLLVQFSGKTRWPPPLFLSRYIIYLSL